MVKTENLMVISRSNCQCNHFEHLLIKSFLILLFRSFKDPGSAKPNIPVNHLSSNKFRKFGEREK